MAKPSDASKTRRERLKALPWAPLLRGAVVLGRRWRALSERDRARLVDLLRQSGGRPGRLNTKERKELRSLAGKLDLKGIGRELLPLVRARRGGHRRRRCRCNRA
jgi:hypothetical protein